MAAPEGYEELGRIGYVDRGNYSVSATYRAGDVVYYNGSSWSALKDNLKGVTPVAGANWRIMAKGFENSDAEDVIAVDTVGIIDGTKNKPTFVQTLFDKIGDWLINKVVTNDNFANKLSERLTNNALATVPGISALDAVMGKNLQDQINVLNTELGGKYTKNPIVIDGRSKSPFHLPLGHYHISPGMSKAYNWPEDDSTTFEGSMIVFGILSDPENNKGYRIYLLATNKSKMYYACEWWGNTPKWYKVTSETVT